jgi:hypothetical protein
VGNQKQVPFCLIVNAGPRTNTVDACGSGAGLFPTVQSALMDLVSVPTRRHCGYAPANRTDNTRFVYI